MVMATRIGMMLMMYAILRRTITLCGNYGTDDAKLFIVQQLRCYDNYNYTIKNHNTQVPKVLCSIAYGSYYCSSTKNELIKLNSSFDEEVYGINIISIRQNKPLTQIKFKYSKLLSSAIQRQNSRAILSRFT